MPQLPLDQVESVVQYLALAAALEGEGQYNLAKLLRAAVDAILRRAAYQQAMPREKNLLAGEIERAAQALATSSAGADLSAAMRSGAARMAEGHLPLVHETPHPYVCRTCGQTVLEAPTQDCPTCGASPATFQRFPPVYWLEALDPFQALAYLRRTPGQVAALLDGLSEGALSRQPEDGGWSVRNVLSHLHDAQSLLNFRIKLMLQEENPSLESKAVFEWAKEEAERPLSARQILDAYLASRRETLSNLESIPVKDWWRSGRHEEFGTVTICLQASYFAMHEITHLSQLESLRSQAMVS